MKSRGFTLVELLAVLVLISVIAIIAVPSIINYINQSEGEIDEATKKLVFSGVELYVNQNKNDFRAPLKQYCVTLQEIVDQKYLSDSIFDSVSGSKIDSNTFVKVINYYNVNKERYDFKYDISNECTEKEYVCIPATEQTVTVGNVPEGNYEAGDEYICQVSNNEAHSFFVLKKENGDNLKLIMNKNLEGKVKWCKSGDNVSCEADAVKEHLTNKTAEWTRLNQSQIILPDAVDLVSSNAPEWMKVNLVEQYTGYWTSTPSGSYRAKFMSQSGLLSDLHTDEEYDGVRPAIIINISEIVD